MFDAILKKRLPQVQPKSNPKGCSCSSLLRQWFQRCLVVHWQLHETLFCLAYVKCPLETYTPKLWEGIDKYLQRVSSVICMGSRVASGKNMPQHRKFTNLLVYQFSTPAGIRSMILTLGMVLDGEGEFVWNCHASKILWFRNVQKLILWPLRLPHIATKCCIPDFSHVSWNPFLVSYVSSFPVWWGRSAHCRHQDSLFCRHCGTKRGEAPPQVRCGSEGETTWPWFFEFCWGEIVWHIRIDENLIHVFSSEQISGV